MTIALDVIELMPVRVVIVPPSATAVPPIVIVLLASWAFGMELVPN